VDVNGKAALITGGASGIGKATCERFAAEGARVLVADMDTAGATAVASTVGGVPFTVDVGDPDQVDAMFAACTAELGGVDIAFLNAGIAIGHSDLSTLDEATYRRIMRVNVDGVVYGLRAAIAAMTERGGGAIVATASLAGIIPFPPDPIYDATKHAVVGLIRSVAPTLAPLGITANCVNPGMTDTNIIGPDAKQALADLDFPLMPADQIADAVLHAVTGGGTGECFVCQPGREHTPYAFRDVPGPRTESARGRVPPGMRDGSKLFEGFPNNP
jgi:NAD(P)-dependent dehydrogenase (short-subunit alcohol dehydrogenase family)